MVELVIINVTFYFNKNTVQQLTPPLKTNPNPPCPFSARSFYVCYIWCMVSFCLDLLPSPHVLTKCTIFTENVFFDIFSIFTDTRFVFSFIIMTCTLDAPMIVSQVTVEGCFCNVGVAAQCTNLNIGRTIVLFIMSYQLNDPPTVSPTSVTFLGRCLDNTHFYCSPVASAMLYSPFFELDQPAAWVHNILKISFVHFLQHFDTNVFLRLIWVKDAKVFFVSEKRFHVVNY